MPPLVLLPPAALHELSVPAPWSPVQLAERPWASPQSSTSPSGEAWLSTCRKAHHLPRAIAVRTSCLRSCLPMPARLPGRRGRAEPIKLALAAKGIEFDVQPVGASSVAGQPAGLHMLHCMAAMRPGTLLVSPPAAQHAGHLLKADGCTHQYLFSTADYELMKTDREQYPFAQCPRCGALACACAICCLHGSALLGTGTGMAWRRGAVGRMGSPANGRQLGVQRFICNGTPLPCSVPLQLCGCGWAGPLAGAYCFHLGSPCDDVPLCSRHSGAKLP